MKPKVVFACDLYERLMGHEESVVKKSRHEKMKKAKRSKK